MEFHVAFFGLSKLEKALHKLVMKGFFLVYGDSAITCHSPSAHGYLCHRQSCGAIRMSSVQDFKSITICGRINLKEWSSTLATLALTFDKIQPKRT